MYVINPYILQRGDIILVRYPNDQTSQLIMRLTRSNYSHAMIYVDLDSVIEAADIVTANNPIRESIASLDDACVLRIKPEYRDEDIINNAIGYARNMIGMEYSKEEARHVFKPPKTVAQPNRQICTRLVAKAFHEAGLPIVENPDYCTLADLEHSEKLEIVKNAFVEVSQEIQEIIDSQNILDCQTDVIASLLTNCREEFNEDIQTLDQLHLYSHQHPERNEQIVTIIENSGYLNLWREEETLNPYNFNADLFIEKYKENAIPAVVQNKLAVDQCEYRYRCNIVALFLESINNGINPYLRCMMTLYYDLIDQCGRRKVVLSEVMNKLSNY